MLSNIEKPWLTLVGEPSVFIFGGLWKYWRKCIWKVSNNLLYIHFTQLSYCLPWTSTRFLHLELPYNWIQRHKYGTSTQNLKDCINLETLTIIQYVDIIEVPRLEEGISLKKLVLRGCFNFERLLDLRKLTKLQVIDILGSNIDHNPGIAYLTMLFELNCAKSRLWNLPNLSGLCKLRKSYFHDCGRLQSLQKIGGLPSLEF